MVQVPAALRAQAEGRPAWDDWLRQAPQLADDLLAEWQLQIDGDAMSGNCAMVVPVRTADRRRAVLKIGWPHPEAETEHLALRAWHGDGAVELWRADPHRFALLLERADAGRDLHALPVLDACEVIAGLYPRLHRPALPQTRRLSEMCVDWANRLVALSPSKLLSPRFVSQAGRLLADFAADPDTDRALIHTDMHYFNVLASHREPWLVIDPKPLAGDPAYEVAPLLWNRWDEITDAYSPRQALLNRMFTVVEVAGLDEDRVRDWIVVREVCNVLWTYEDHVRDGSPLQQNWVTAATTILKAVQR